MYILCFGAKNEVQPYLNHFRVKNEVIYLVNKAEPGEYLINAATPTNEVQTRLQRGPNKVLRNGLTRLLNAITF